MSPSATCLDVAGLAAAAILTLTGCGAAVERTNPPADTTSVPAAATPAPDEPSSAGAEPSPSLGSPTADAPTEVTPQPSTSPTAQEPDTPYRRVRGSFEGVAVTAEIFPVRRAGSTSTASVRFVSSSASGTFRILDALNDHNPEVGDKGSTSPDGLRLLDPEGKKAYLPATIRDRECLCSPTRNGYRDHYTDVTVSVTFAAPPSTLTAIDVLVPRFGTVSNVPIH